MGLFSRKTTTPMDRGSTPARSTGSGMSMGSDDEFGTRKPMSPTGRVDYASLPGAENDGAEERSKLASDRKLRISQTEQERHGPKPTSPTRSSGGEGWGSTRLD